jgi:Flp pilus assembly protein TadG
MCETQARRDDSRSRSREKGSAALEGALCLLLFLMLIFSFMDFGRMLFAYNQMAYAARVGTRYAAVHGAKSGSTATGDDVQSVIRAGIVGLDPTAVTVTTTWTPDKNPGSTANVRVQYPFDPMPPYLISLGSFNVQSVSQVVIIQ